MKNKGLLIVGIVIVIFLLVFLNSRNWQNSTPCLSLTFDDGLKSHYEIVYPTLKEKNFGGTFFIVANETEFEKRFRYPRDLMTQDQIQEISNEGFEIGSHTLTHPLLTEISDDEIEKELKESKEILETTYDIEVDSVACPRFGHNKGILEIAKKYYLNARSIFNNRPTGFVLESFGFKNDTSSDTVCNYIDIAEKNDRWLILVFHDITDEPRLWDTTIENFNNIMQCAEDSGIVVDSLKGCRERLN